MLLEYIVPDDIGQVKLLKILEQDLKLSSRLIRRLKRQSGILVNGIPHRVIDPVKPGDRIGIIWSESAGDRLVPEERHLDILFEDNWFLAVNKPAGIAVHPTWNHPSGTLANAVQFYYLKNGLDIKVRPVNRLDRGTSGVTLFAKHTHAQDRIIALMKQNQVYKEYWGVVEGCFSPDSGTIDLPIQRKPGSVMERWVHPLGERSVTHYRTLRIFKDRSLVQFVLETGRTHQIRVHCKACGHPILGDWLYSDQPVSRTDRHALHSRVLRFEHPATGKLTEITAPVPEDFNAFLEQELDMS